jgi:hypothetical protein
MIVVNTKVNTDHDYVFVKIDDAIYKCIKDRFGDLVGFVSAGHVIMAMNDAKCALLQSNGVLYYSNHPAYGY